MSQPANAFDSSLLKGIPTNAQLTLTLLRIGEANASPLPPPPVSHDKAPSRAASLHHEELALGATSEEIEQAASPGPASPGPEHPAFSGTELSEKFHRNTWASRVVSLFRGTTATGVESKRGIDRMRAVIGSRHAKNRVGVLQRKGRLRTPIGPVEFDARYKGKHGAVVIDSTKEPAVLYFTTDSPEGGDLKLESRKKGSVMFTIPVTDIREMGNWVEWDGKANWLLGGPLEAKRSWTACSSRARNPTRAIS